VVGHQPYAPAAFTPGKIPGTHFSEAESTSGHMVLSEFVVITPVYYDNRTKYASTLSIIHSLNLVNCPWLQVKIRNGKLDEVERSNDSKTYCHGILYSVDRAFRHKFLLITDLMHLFHVFIYSFHLSTCFKHQVLMIRDRIVLIHHLV